MVLRPTGIDEKGKEKAPGKTPVGPTRPEKEPPEARPLDPVAKLGDDLTRASGERAGELLRRLREGKGSTYTEVLAGAIPRLNEDLQRKARVALAERLARMKDSTLKRFIRLPHFDEHLALHRVDCLSSHGDLEFYDYVRAWLDATPPEVLRPVRLITGEDLVALGYPQGPIYREILNAVETAQLDGELATPDQARAFVQARWPLS